MFLHVFYSWIVTQFFYLLWLMLVINGTAEFRFAFNTTVFGNLFIKI